VSAAIGPPPPVGPLRWPPPPLSGAVPGGIFVVDGSGKVGRIGDDESLGAAPIDVELLGVLPTTVGRAESDRDNNDITRDLEFFFSCSECTTKVSAADRPTDRSRELGHATDLSRNFSASEFLPGVMMSASFLPSQFGRKKSQCTLARRRIFFFYFCSTDGWWRRRK
jgi:hypothetical protein